MDALWMTLGALLMLAGLAGCVLPFLPGPPLCFIALLMQQLTTAQPFSSKFLGLWAGVAALVTALDYFIPIYGAKRYGGTRAGMWGCTLGLLAGFWLGPLGIIVGPFVGAFVGEVLANQNTQQALRAAWGSFMGFVWGTLLKLVACLVMAWYLGKFIVAQVAA